MSPQPTAVIDYNAGNLKSVETALRYLGINFFVTNRPDEVSEASRLIIPGVGEARAAMEILTGSGLNEAIKSFFKKGNPILGICLGCQIIFELSEERDTVCLGLVSGKVRRLPRTPGFKIPHMGWNRLLKTEEHPLFDGISADSSFYFVHSYYPSPACEQNILCLTDYNIKFPSGIISENLAAFQFHPEKSGKQGLKLLENFFRWAV